MTLKNFKFNVTFKDKYSRTGVIETHRGNINTPVFMPVGTQATVKAVFIDDVIELLAKVSKSSLLYRKKQLAKII